MSKNDENGVSQDLICYRTTYAGYRVGVLAVAQNLLMVNGRSDCERSYKRVRLSCGRAHTTHHHHTNPLLTNPGQLLLLPLLKTSCDIRATPTPP
ncbi:hypothetical protein Y032_0007g3424 [Ancylostoma ceylanicum]|uniref:Uncharacterized protein n=1 Tax=Ancylostoma ceylanicum TaxID=53326 RepID=A0A016VP08_9BILA|nr:hypothetical protein Y032_0007g3424 [Ancylostoma ceylanicum]